MSTEMKIRLALYMCVTLGAFAVGRHSVPQQPKTDTQVNQVATINKDEHKNVHSVKTTKTEPNGTKTTTVTTDITSQDSETLNKRVSEHQVVTPSKGAKINISIIGTNDFTRTVDPTYGLSVSREFLGPITVGAFGLRSGVIGLSLGINF